MVTHRAGVPAPERCSARSFETRPFNRPRDVPEHHALEGFWPAEQRAILWFRVELRSHLQRSVTVEETLDRWQKGPGAEWRREKMRIDLQQQICEIELHKYLLSETAGFDVGWEHAATDWVRRYAATWREWWEEQPDSLPDVLAFL